MQFSLIKNIGQDYPKNICLPVSLKFWLVIHVPNQRTKSHDAQLECQQMYFITPDQMQNVEI